MDDLGLHILGKHAFLPRKMIMADFPLKIMHTGKENPADERTFDSAREKQWTKCTFMYIYRCMYAAACIYIYRIHHIYIYIYISCTIHTDIYVTGGRRGRGGLECRWLGC